MNRREILLDAMTAAHRLHNELKIEDSVRLNGGGVDVFGAIRRKSIPLMFRPLDKLLGTCLPPPHSGIMITSRRPLAIQRFTASHELGHRMLNHKFISLDNEDILTRTPLAKGNYNIDEAAADAFAAAFIVPEWILEIHAERQDWDVASLSDPRIVYQLALRIGVSYEATCRQLRQYKLITPQIFTHLTSIDPKSIKQSLLRGYALPNWYPNVWLLTEHDEDSIIQGGPDDVFLFQLKENSGSGYLWDFNDLAKSGFARLSDDVSVPANNEEIGGAVDRFVLAKLDQPSNSIGGLNFSEMRPWDPTAINNTLTLKYELVKESGLPNAERGLLAA